MQWVGLGKVTVATAGTPVKLSNVTLKVHSVIVTYDPTDTGSIYVKDSGGNVVAVMGANSTSPVILDSGSGQNAIDLSKYSVDTSVNGKGPYVGYSLG
jgi:hypothetical protein